MLGHCSLAGEGDRAGGVDTPKAGFLAFRRRQGGRVLRILRHRAGHAGDGTGVSDAPRACSRPSEFGACSPILRLHVLVGPLRRAQRGERTGIQPRIKSEAMFRRNMRGFRARRMCGEPVASAPEYAVTFHDESFPCRRRGRRRPALVPLLLAAGHSVIGTTRSGEKACELKARGVTAVVVDVYDAAALRDAAVRGEPRCGYPPIDRPAQSARSRRPAEVRRATRGCASRVRATWWRPRRRPASAG